MGRDIPSWHAARERCAVFDVAAGFVVLTGPERGPYLHSLVTNTVAGLAPGSGRRGFFLTPTKGRILADFLACESGDALWLECAGESAPVVMETLGKYYFGQDVAFEDRSVDWRVLALQGPESPASLERMGLPIPGEEAGAHAMGRLGEVETRVVRRSDTGETGFHLWVPATERERVRTEILASGAEPGDAEAWTVLQIEAGIAAFGRELGEETIPLEASVEEAISFDKGCYPGQEVIARLHVRGRPARQLRGLRIEDELALASGDRLDAADKRQVATVTASGVSPALGTVALAFVQRDYVEPGTRLTTADGRTAEVAELPMISLPASARSAG